MYFGGIPVLISYPGDDFLGWLWSMRSRVRRMRRLVMKVSIVMEYHRIVRNPSY